jgi:hypothetical protein
MRLCPPAPHAPHHSTSPFPASDVLRVPPARGQVDQAPCINREIARTRDQATCIGHDVVAVFVKVCAHWLIRSSSRIMVGAHCLIILSVLRQCRSWRRGQSYRRMA